MFSIIPVSGRLRISGTTADGSEEKYFRKEKKYLFLTDTPVAVSTHAPRSCFSRPFSKKMRHLLKVVDSRTGQEKQKMTLEHFVRPEHKEVLRMDERT